MRPSKETVKGWSAKSGPEQDRVAWERWEEEASAPSSAQSRCPPPALETPRAPRGDRSHLHVGSHFNSPGFRFGGSF